MLCALSFSSCTGTGGSANAIGEVYNPDGTPVSSGNSGSGTGGGNTTGSSGRPGATEAASGSVSQTVSVELLHELANSGNADGISGQFPNGEDESSKTFFLNLSAQDFGMPADGYMILSLDSDGFAPGLSPHWEDTQFVSAENGMLFFADIPMVQVGSHVTVTIRCYAKDGTLISSGYCSGTAKVDGVPLSISVIGSPEISVENGTANGNMAVQGGVQYEVLEYTDAAAVSMTAVNGNEGSTMVVQVNGTTVATTTASSMSAPLSDGFNAIVATVSKGSNEPIELKRNVYVVKALSVPTVTFSGGTRAPTEDTATYEMWKYSFLSVENLTLSVTNTYDGDNAATGNSTMAVAVTGITSFTSASGDVSARVLNDGLQTIAVTLTKPYCTPIEITKTICAKIKPVTVWTDKSYYYGDRGTSGRDSTIKGNLSLQKNSETAVPFKTLDSDFDNYSWVEFWNNGASFILEEKTDTINFTASGMKWDGNSNGDGTDSFTLADIAASKRAGDGQYNREKTTSNWKISIYYNSSD